MTTPGHRTSPSEFPAALRRGWGARLAGWLGLLAILVNLVAPLAAATGRDSGEAALFICHADLARDRPAPLPADDDTRHCPFCVVLATPALTPPGDAILTAPEQPAVAIRIPAPPPRTARAAVAASAHRSRAPPVLA